MAAGFFIFILELVELFANLWKYMSLNVPLTQVFRVLLLYAPTCLVWALPIALLFAISFALGNLYASNELVAVFGTGISLLRFTLPLLFVAALLSTASFFWSDLVALPAYREKTRLVADLLSQNPSLSNTEVTVLARQGRVVYHATFYDDASQSLSDLSIIERDAEGHPVARTGAATARWQNGTWTLLRVRRFVLEGGEWKEGDYGSYTNPEYNEEPPSFRNQNFDLAELSSVELGERAKFQASAGLPYAATIAERHRRLSFSFAPLVVALLSAAIGGRYRKNVLLMSLLVSLVIATGYYVFQMVTMLLAKTGVLEPAVGAWSPLVLFALIAAGLYRFART
jgi:lipopolysaccharide export system permease protein